MRVFTFLAVIVSCLGAYGLIMFSAARRKKEIGVRKVHGASVQSILVLMYKEFTWMLALGLIISIPPVYYLTSIWLENFYYRISVSPVVFVAGGLTMLAVVWVTIGFQSVRAALANPVDTLRQE